MSTDAAKLYMPTMIFSHFSHCITVWLHATDTTYCNTVKKIILLSLKTVHVWQMLLYFIDHPQFSTTTNETICDNMYSRPKNNNCLCYRGQPCCFQIHYIWSKLLLSKRRWDVKFFTIKHQTVLTVTGDTNLFHQ